MPRKVLIDKKTLQEILEKYQGGATGGSGKLYEFMFELTTYGLNGELIPHNEGVVVLYIYESNFERIKTAASSLGITFNTPQDLVTLINTTFNKTVGSYDDYNECILLVYLCNSVDFVNGVTSNGVTRLRCDDFGLYTNTNAIGTPNYLSFVGTDQETIDYAYGLNVNNSCTLTEYGTSASGGTVEAEPIVSIKMTNLDVRQMDSSEQQLGDFEFYCTKKRWDDFVSLAAIALQTEVTYQNFDTVFKALTLQFQGFALGYLLMDYYTKEILPNAIIIRPPSDMNMTYHGKVIMSSVMTTTYLEPPYPDYVLDTSFVGENIKVLGIDKGSTDLVTADTVITVEEIAGPAIGASDSGTSEIKTTLVSVNLGRANDITMAEYNAHFVIADNVLNDGIALANQQLSQLGITLTRYNWSTTISTLLSTNEGKIVFNSLMQQLLANSINVYGTDYDGHTTKVFIGSIGVWTIGDDGNPLTALSSTLAQGYTLQGNGSSSGGETTASQYDYIQLCFGSSNSNHIVIMLDKKFSRASDIPTNVNQLTTTLNQMGSLSIPTYTDLEDLEDIADYLNALDTQTYAQIKVVFWASVLGLFPYFSLTIKGYENGALTPTFVEGVADLNSQDFAYTIKMMDNTGQMNNVATEQTVFDFDVFVNHLD